MHLQGGDCVPWDKEHTGPDVIDHLVLPEGADPMVRKSIRHGNLEQQRSQTGNSISPNHKNYVHVLRARRSSRLFMWERNSCNRCDRAMEDLDYDPPPCLARHFVYNQTPRSHSAPSFPLAEAIDQLLQSSGPAAAILSRSQRLLRTRLLKPLPQGMLWVIKRWFLRRPYQFQ